MDAALLIKRGRILSQCHLTTTALGDTSSKSGSKSGGTKRQI